MVKLQNSLVFEADRQASTPTVPHRITSGSVSTFPVLIKVTIPREFKMYSYWKCKNSLYNERSKVFLVYLSRRTIRPVIPNGRTTNALFLPKHVRRFILLAYWADIV